MKKTSHRNYGSSAGGSFRRWKWIGSAIVCVALVLGAMIWREPLSGVLWRVVSPLMLFRTNATSTEVEQLQEALASSTAALADRNLLAQENVDLEARLGRDGNRQVILAGVLMRPPATPYDTLMIDAGSAEGVAVGDSVAASGSALIGLVEQVYPTTARVVLFSAPGQTFSALLTPGDGAAVPLTITGQGNGSMTAVVPAGTPVVPGEPVVFPGIVGGLSATVVAVSTKGDASFETLYFQPVADPLELRFVEVWRP